jgi:hypothetical protein
MTIRRTVLSISTAALLTAAAAPAGAKEWTEIVKFSGYLSSDIRFTIEDYRGAVQGQGFNFSKNQNDLDLRLEITPFEKVLVVAEPHLRFFGINEAYDLQTASVRSNIDPYDVRLEEAYVMVKEFLWKKMDMRVGRLIQNWGSVDIFNPTDNLNARDFSDVLDYTAKVPNQMLELNMYPADWLSIHLVWVPMFTPSQLPDSAVLGFAVATDRNGCLISAPTPPIRNRADAEKLASIFKSVDPCSLNFPNTQVTTLLPDNGIGDSQAAARFRFKAGDLDLNLSYYYGRFTFPVALDAYAEVAGSTTKPGKMDVSYSAELYYPRMHVAGLDFAYSAPWFFDVGFTGELAVIFPEEVVFGMRVPSAGLSIKNVNVPATPFVKATAGVDYTFTKWLYMNAMYIRGFFDEFNDLYGLHNYVTLAADLKFLDNELQIRLSGILDCNDLSNVAYGQITWVVVPSVEMTWGAFYFGGDTNMKDPLDYSSRYKFGQKAAGRSFAFFKTKVTW